MKQQLSGAMVVLWQDRGPSIGQLGALESKAWPDGDATAAACEGESQLPMGICDSRPLAREANEGMLTMVEVEMCGGQ